MVSLGRWTRAQEYERGYWASQAKQIAAGATTQLDWYRWRADQLIAWLRRLGLAELTEGSAKVIEVGSGPVGLAGQFLAAERLLIDPLADYYATNEVLTALRNPDAVYRAGSGEKLPADSGRYDLAIIENCIDHVQDMDGVMRELARVLRPGAWLYITVNCRSPWGYYVHRILSLLRLDPGHPHTFTPARLERLVRRFGFRTLDQQFGSYQQAREKDRASDSARARLKARLGISEYRAALVACLETSSGSKPKTS